MPESSAFQEMRNNFDTSSPVSFYDFYNAYGASHSPGQGKWSDSDPYSFGGWFQNLLHGTRQSAEKEYENYKADWEAYQNNKKTQVANAETYSREDTQVQRLMEDYQNAGLNPYLLLNGGNISGGVVSSQSQYQPYKRASSTKKDESKIASSALKILAIIALKSLM